MKKNYSSPELELINLAISKDVLAVSDPMETTPVGEGVNPANPGSDPFGDLIP
ncbi:hypothetical protein [uncultured Ruminococcus sp.]|uniref:hypothetical protein n=1 Tax=uncultured Ruminococcus sp. TaxID=165186 RepID=UPI00292FBD71|nr:hypothetical protein [uncultured Ruminococcus sp.]